MEFYLQPGMIDTHFHGLIMAENGIDSIQVLKRSFSDGLLYAVDIGTHLGDLANRFKLMGDIENILFAAGSYPSEVEKDSVQNLADSLEGIIEEKNFSANTKQKISAIGEIGLDWHWGYGTKSQQMELLEAQIVLANRYNLPVLIHNREADKEIIEILTITLPAAGGIMHCFSSNYNTAVKCLDLGLSISFAGNVTYKKNIELREIAAQIPVQSIFAETDSPYLSPQKVRGKPNHPGHIGYTYDVVSECLGIPVEKLISSIKDNFNKMFSQSSLLIQAV